MTINSRDELIDALANTSSRIIIDKASLPSATGAYCSMWRSTGQPTQGAIPAAAAAVCNNNTVGAVGFQQQVAPATSYLSWLFASSSVNPVVLEVHDRLVHMGGLSGTVTTAQTVGIDLNSLLASDNIDERKGDANFSDVTWWLEWYTATGATGVNITVNVTYNDGTTGNLTALALAATRPASWCITLNTLIPAGTAKFIRGINTVTISATTGTAGNFGVTATRQRTALPMPLANLTNIGNWADLGLPEIFNASCLYPVILCGTTSTGAVRGGGKISHG